MGIAAGTLVDLLRQRCPEFTPEGSTTQTGKAELLVGRVNGSAVIAKRLTDPAPLWRRRFHHELQAYRLFAAIPPPVAVPRLVLADRDNDLLIVERLSGAPLANERYPPTPHDPVATTSMLKAASALSDWRPPAEPLGRPWNYETRIERYRERYGILNSRDAELIMRLLERVPWRWTFAHGDFLARNCLATAGGAGLALVDWEFAGWYLPGFDLALLWTTSQADALLRSRIDRTVIDSGVQVKSGFAVNQALVLAREIRLHRELAASHQVGARLARLREDFAAVRERLGGSGTRLH